MNISPEETLVYKISDRHELKSANLEVVSLKPQVIWRQENEDRYPTPHNIGTFTENKRALNITKASLLKLLDALVI